MQYILSLSVKVCRHLMEYGHFKRILPCLLILLLSYYPYLSGIVHKGRPYMSGFPHPSHED